MPCILFIFRVIAHNLVSFENANPSNFLRNGNISNHVSELVRLSNQDF